MADFEEHENSAPLNRRIEGAYESAQRNLDTPMTLLALALGIILLVQFTADLSPTTNQTLDVLGWFIWSAFVLEYLLLLWLAPDRHEMVKTHKLDRCTAGDEALRPTGS